MGRKGKMEIRKSYVPYLKWLNLALFLFMMGAYVCAKHYSLDDFDYYFYQGRVAKEVAVINLRPIQGIVYGLLALSGIQVVKYQVFFGIILLLCFSFCTYKISSLLIVKMNCKDSLFSCLLVDLGSVLLYGNVFTSEWIWYTEQYLAWAMAITFMLFAVLYGAGKNNSFKSDIISFMFLVLATGTYQTVLIHFWVICFIIFYIEKCDNSYLFKQMAKSICYGGGAIIVNIGVGKIASMILGMQNNKSRISIGNIGEILKEYVVNQKYIWVNGMNMLPYGCLIFVFVVLFFLWFYLINRMGKNLILNVFWLLVNIGIVLGCIAAIQVMQGYCVLAVRVIMPIFSIFSLLIWWITFLLLNNDNVTIKVKHYLLVFISIFWAVNLFEMQLIAMDVVKTNALDFERIKLIENKIVSYENETNCMIIKAGFCQDAYPQYRYYDVLFHSDMGGDICATTFANTWADCNAINYYTGRNLQRIEVPQNIKRQIKEKNWDVLNLEEQMIFDGDTVYIVMY